MEAMASGKPVVSTNIGGSPDIIINGSTGILVPPDNVSALRNALPELLTHRDIITRMGQTSLERVAHFTARSVVPRIEQVYHTVIQARAASHTSITKRARAVTQNHAVLVKNPAP